MIIIILWLLLVSASNRAPIAGNMSCLSGWPATCQIKSANCRQSRPCLYNPPSMLCFFFKRTEIKIYLLIDSSIDLSLPSWILVGKGVLYWEPEAKTISVFDAFQIGTPRCILWRNNLAALQGLTSDSPFLLARTPSCLAGLAAAAGPSVRKRPDGPEARCSDHSELRRLQHIGQHFAIIRWCANSENGLH